MTGQPFVALADWGTSRLRIWLCDETGVALGYDDSDDGMAKCREGGPSRFASVFGARLAAIGASADLPAVISGMAGARDGWREADYIRVPTSLDDLAARAVSVDAARPVHILPGLSQDDPADVMRGEEVQIVGAGVRDGLLCLPGTHSKWVTLKDGGVTGFRTSMTGELFDLLAKRSLLTASVEGDGAIGDDPAFVEAVQEMKAEASKLTSALFSIRARGLLHGHPGRSGRARLSGLLIGAEIAAAPAVETVHLIADRKLAGLYALALENMGGASVILDGEQTTRNGLFSIARSIIGDRS